MSSAQAGAPVGRHGGRQPWAGLVGLVAGASLVACATQARVGPSAAVAADGPRASSATPSATAVQAYAARERARARELEHDGALAEAALVWELLSLLTPILPEDTASAPVEWARVRLAAARGASLRMRAAQAARQRGDEDAARRLYLAALALEPGNTAAAESLRALEAERNRRRAPQSGRAGASPTHSATAPRTVDASGDALATEREDDGAAARRADGPDAPGGASR